ncbi:MAG: hypothetical protein HUU29_12055 [Planctomycetaceae bacterium]|nr:hypothetical protein [Planctomycetaceae bacterium]
MRAVPSLLLIGALFAPCAQAQEKAAPLPKAVIEEIDVTIHNDQGGVAGRVKGKRGTTDNNGVVEVDDAEVSLYSTVEGEDKPRLDMRATAKHLRWKSEQYEIVCDQGLKLVFGEERAKTLSGLDADSAVIVYRHGGKTLERISITEARNVSFDGSGISAKAPQLSIDVVFGAAADSRAHGIREFTAVAAKGIDIGLPPAIGLGTNTPDNLRATCKGKAELRALRTHESGESALQVTMHYGARVAPPESTYPLLAGDTLALRCLTDDGNLVLRDVEADGSAFASIEQPQGLVQGSAKSLRLEIEYGEREVTGHTFRFTRNPVLWISRSRDEAAEEKPKQDPADGGNHAIELRADFSITLSLKKDAWSLDASERVRGVIRLHRQSEARLNGDELSIILDPAQRSGSGEDDMSPSQLREFRCSGRGVLPRLALTQGDDTRIALFARSVEGKRAEGGAFAIDLGGGEIEANLTLPRALLAEGILQMANPTILAPREETTYRIASVNDASITLNSLTPFAPGGAGSLNISLETSEDTIIEEEPHDSRLRSHVACGQLLFTMSLAPAAGQKALVLNEASLNARPLPGGTTVRAAVGSDIVEASSLALKLSQGLLESTLAAPVNATLRSSWLLAFINERLAAQPGLLDSRVTPEIDAATLTSSGSIVQRAEYERDNKGAIRSVRLDVGIDRPFSFEGRRYDVAPRLTGEDAFAEWEALRENDHVLCFHLSGDSFSWTSSGIASLSGGFVAVVDGNAKVELPLQESLLTCSRLGLTGADGQYALHAQKPVHIEIKGSGQGLLEALATPGRKGKDANRYESASLIVDGEASAVIMTGATPALEMKCSGPFTLEGRRKDSTDMVRADSLHMKTLVNAGQGLSALQLLRMKGSVEIRTGDNSVKGESLQFRPERLDVVLDGSPVDIGFKRESSLEGIESVTLRETDDGQGAALRASGKRITLRLKLERGTGEKAAK